MIRSFGDTQALKVGVSNIPEIFEYNVNHVKPVAIIVPQMEFWNLCLLNKLKIF